MTKDKYPAVEDRGDMIILRGELGSDVIYNIFTDNTDNIEELLTLFDVSETEYLADPTDSFYQVIQFMRVITRKSDKKRFGFQFWASPGNDHMDGGVESNAHEHRIEVEYNDDWEPIGGEVFVFVPVVPFVRTGYKFPEDTND